MLPELTKEEYSAALDQVAWELLEELSISKPPVDALALAQAMGLNIAWDDSQRGRGRIVRLRDFSGGPPQGSILLRPDPRPERLQWAVAHEIGETCARRVFERLSIDPREAALGARENVSNQLASRILLPRAWFESRAKALGWDLPRLKHIFSTASHELLARRMLDFEQPVAISVFDHGRATWRQTNFARAAPALSTAEATAWRAAHEEGRAVVQTDRFGRVQAWPVHEPEWKREILRTEWEPFEVDQF
jgi:hypothetical protein